MTALDCAMMHHQNRGTHHILLADVVRLICPNRVVLGYSTALPKGNFRSAFDDQLATARVASGSGRHRHCGIHFIGIRPPWRSGEFADDPGL
jgi:hypothetical protein